jgi:hypothetical protein
MVEILCLRDGNDFISTAVDEEDGWRISSYERGRIGKTRKRGPFLNAAPSNRCSGVTPSTEFGLSDGSLAAGFRVKSVEAAIAIAACMRVE